MSNQPFWKTKTLVQMNAQEWESLCDGCGKCCCIRMEDEDNGKIYVTNVSCKLFDPATCRCTDYEDRRKTVPDCVQVTPGNVAGLKWMPQTCAYRLLSEGKDLPDYHYLVSGDRDSIHRAGMSVQNAVIPEGEIASEDDLPNHITEWPGEPKVFSDE